MEPPDKGHFRVNSFVPCRELEVVPISEVLSSLQIILNSIVTAYFVGLELIVFGLLITPSRCFPTLNKINYFSTAI